MQAQRADHLAPGRLLRRQQREAATTAGQRALLRWAAEHHLGQQDDAVSGVGLAGARRAVSAAAPGACMSCRLRRRAGVAAGGRAGQQRERARDRPVPARHLRLAGDPRLVAEGPGRRVGRGPSEAPVRRVAGQPAGTSARPQPEHGPTPGAAPSASSTRSRPASRSGCQVDVLTPHVKPLLRDDRGQAQDPVEPPAEYHNPVPLNFLTVSGAFAVDLYGSEQPTWTWPGTG